MEHGHTSIVVVFLGSQFGKSHTPKLHPVGDPQIPTTVVTGLAVSSLNASKDRLTARHAVGDLAKDGLVGRLRNIIQDPSRNRKGLKQVATHSLNGNADRVGNPLPDCFVAGRVVVR